MSILYCTIPHFAAALARRDHPGLRDRPLVLIGPEERVFDVSTEAAACDVVAGLTARMAAIRCPQARLLDADVARCRQEYETLLQLLERSGPNVEPHGWDAAYVDLDDMVRDRSDAVALCGEIGRTVRQELGDALQPALGWDSGKFTAQAAARRTRPGRLLVVPTARERDFLNPLPVALLPLAEDTLRRLRFLGLRTLGQYAALPPAAVWQQFGRPGKLAHRYARGEDDRPVVPRWQAPCLTAHCEFEPPLTERERLLAALRHLVTPMLKELEENLQACGQLRLTVHFDDDSAEERIRTLFPTAKGTQVIRALGQLLDGMHGLAGRPALSTALGAGSHIWIADTSAGKTGVSAVAVTLEQIQDAVMEQLTFFSAQNERERKLQRVQRYLAIRFGANRLWRAALLQPGAPLPEWRVGWVDEGQP